MNSQKLCRRNRRDPAVLGFILLVSSCSWNASRLSCSALAAASCSSSRLDQQLHIQRRGISQLTNVPSTVAAFNRTSDSLRNRNTSNKNTAWSPDPDIHLDNSPNSSLDRWSKDSTSKKSKGRRPRHERETPPTEPTPQELVRSLLTPVHDHATNLGTLTTTNSKHSAAAVTTSATSSLANLDNRQRRPKRYNLSKLKFLSGWEKLDVLRQFLTTRHLEESLHIYTTLSKNPILAERLKHKDHHDMLHLLLQHPYEKRCDLLRVWRAPSAEDVVRANMQGPGAAELLVSGVGSHSLLNSGTTVSTQLATINSSIISGFMTGGILWTADAHMHMLSVAEKWGDRAFMREVWATVVQEKLVVDIDTWNRLIRCHAKGIWSTPPVSAKELVLATETATSQERWEVERDRGDEKREQVLRSRVWFEPSKEDVRLAKDLLEMIFVPRSVAVAAKAEADAESKEVSIPRLKLQAPLPNAATFELAMDLYTQLNDAQALRDLWTTHALSLSRGIPNLRHAMEEERNKRVAKLSMHEREGKRWEMGARSISKAIERRKKAEASAESFETAENEEYFDDAAATSTSNNDEYEEAEEMEEIQRWKRAEAKVPLLPDIGLQLGTKMVGALTKLGDLHGAHAVAITLLPYTQAEDDKYMFAAPACKKLATNFLNACLKLAAKLAATSTHPSTIPTDTQTPAKDALAFAHDTWNMLVKDPACAVQPDAVSFGRRIEIFGLNSDMASAEDVHEAAVERVKAQFAGNLRTRSRNLCALHIALMMAYSNHVVHGEGGKGDAARLLEKARRLSEMISEQWEEFGGVRKETLALSERLVSEIESFCE